MQFHGIYLLALVLLVAAATILPYVREAYDVGWLDYLSLYGTW